MMKMEAQKPNSIENILKAIKGKTKPQQLNILKQEKNNYSLYLSSTTGTNAIVNNLGFGQQLDELLHKVENDNSYKYDSDWNWFFNADHIRNQELVFATKDFLEQNRKDEMDSLFMMNVLLRQMDELRDNLDKPVDFVSKLKELPLNEMQRHTLMGLLLKWHGGYPVNNLNPKYNTILKLIEREFLNMFPDQLTREKEFCAIDIATQKQIKEAEAHISAETKKHISFVESRYIQKVNMDFEDLPKYIIQRGIIWRFEAERLTSDAEFLTWKEKLLEFLDTIPKVFKIKTLQKGLDYGKKVYQYHLHNECSKPEDCTLNQSWERRIALAEQILYVIDPEPKKTYQSTQSSKKYDFSNYDIPVIPISNPERLWMETIYDKEIKGLRFTFREIRGKLHNELPATFRPENMDNRLISNDGEEIKLLGIVAIQNSFEILEKVNSVIYSIRDIILTHHEKRNILISEIAEACNLTPAEITLCLKLVREFGIFYGGTSYDSDSTIIKSIDVGGSNEIYYSYIEFPGVEQLIVVKSYQSFIQPGETFTFEEKRRASEKIDEVVQELQSLKAGQEVIWSDILNELNELKAHFGLNKKNWRQLFTGKIAEMVASGIISETISKKIAEIINPTLTKLLN